MEFSKDDLLLLYRNMVRGRKFDEAINELCRKAIVPGMWHSGIGHDATQAGAASFLRRDDWLGITHRGITAGLAKGLDAKRWLAEHVGRAGGYAKGKGGHYCGDKDVGMLPVTLTMGGAFPIASGAGIAAKNEGKGQVVVCLFGEGQAQRGTLHECMNLASVWKLPIVWVCENNQYYITTHAKDALAAEDVAAFAHSYAMPGVVVDGQDVLAVSEAMIEAVGRARSGRGPSLVECKTYRIREHGEFDIDTSYRTKEEVEQWKKRDSIVLFKKLLLGEGSVSEAELEVIDDEIERELEAAIAWALESPEPALEEAFTDLYAA